MLKLLEKLENKLSNTYETIDINSKVCFLKSDGTVVHLTGIPSFHSIVVEFADTLSDAEKNLFEDGDMVSTEGAEEIILDQIIKAIEEG